MTSADIAWETMPCDLCGSGEWRVEFAFALPEGRGNLVRCRHCGLCFVSPRPIRADLGHFYPSAYYSFQPPPPPPPPVGWHANLRRSILRHGLGYTHLEPNGIWGRFLPASLVALPRFVPNGWALDVGCGSGAKLLELQTLGWKTAGLELSAPAVAAARRAGLEVAEGSLEGALPWDDGRFDAITFYHSLEHHPSPRQALERAGRLLKPGGELLVVVPNYASWERRLMGRRWSWMMIPQHLHHFTPATLSAMVTRSGFENIALTYSAAGVSLPPWGGKAGRGIMRLLDLLAVILHNGKAILLTARAP